MLRRRRVITLHPAGKSPRSEGLRDDLKAEPELVILFGDSIKGDAVRQLVAFGDSLGIPVKYVLPGGLFEFARRGRHGLAARPGPGIMPRPRSGLASTRCSARRISTSCGWSARIR